MRFPTYSQIASIESCKVASRRSTRRQKNHGMAFATTMLVLLGVLVIMLVGTIGGGNGLMSEAGNGLQMASARANSTSALAVADAGVELTLQWLGAQSAPPSQHSALAPALWGGSPSGTRTAVNYPNPADSSSQFRVVIYPDANNTSQGEQGYLIESTGQCNQSVQTIRVYVRSISLGRFNYLSDYSSSSFWTNGVNLFDGLVHCNNTDGKPAGILWHSNSSSPVFLENGSLTVSETAIRWSHETTTTLQPPAATTDWSAVAVSGQSSIHVGTPTVPLPSNTDAERLAALAGTAAPSQTGVVVPNSGGASIGGIYIHGDASQITFTTLIDVLGLGSIQVITITQKGSLGLPLVTVITVDATQNVTTYLSTQTTSLLPIANLAVYTGVPNGVIYSDGNIGAPSGSTYVGGLSGTIANNGVSGGTITHTSSWTVATAPTMTVAIDGNLEYLTQRQASGGRPVAETSDSNFTLNAGTLGIVSDNIEVGARTTQLGSTPTTVQVDAALVALNTCEAADHAMTSTGTFVNNGIFVTEHAGSFGSISSGGSLLSGYTTTRYYDARIKTSPPPAFPSFTGVYEVVSWRNVSAPLS
jgi:hypothetical protein